MVEHTVEHTMVCRRDVYGPAQARQWLSDRLGDRVAAPDLDTLRLVLSELVTNAVLHAKGRSTCAQRCRIAKAVSKSATERPTVSPWCRWSSSRWSPIMGGGCDSSRTSRTAGAVP